MSSVLGRVRLNIDASVLGALLAEHSLSIDDFHSIDDDSKKVVRRLFLEATAKHIRRSPAELD